MERALFIIFDSPEDVPDTIPTHFITTHLPNNFIALINTTCIHNRTLLQSIDPNTPHHDTNPSLFPLRDREPL